MNKHPLETKRWVRWLGTFVGFPVAGLAARAVVGNIDSPNSAAIGGLTAGAVLGALQVGIGGIDADDRSRWIGATAIGFGVGLALGAAAIDYRTDTASLVVMGAISGAGVGLAQALSIPMRRIDRIMWAAITPALWAGAWLMTSQIIVDADRQHAVFGLPSGLATCAVAGVLYARRIQARQPMVGSVGTLTEQVAA